MPAKQSVASESDHKPSHEEKVRDRAYQLWQDAGCPHGQDHHHWAQAEQDVLNGAKKTVEKKAAAKAVDEPKQAVKAETKPTAKAVEKTAEKAPAKKAPAKAAAKTAKAKLA